MPSDYYSKLKLMIAIDHIINVREGLSYHMIMMMIQDNTSAIHKWVV